MTTKATSTLIVSRAQTLADQVMTAYKDKAISDSLPTDTFMAHRPDSLAESYQHGLAVAQILADWHLDPALQAAGLLHSFVCKGVLSAEQVAEVCDQRTAFLCSKYWDFLQQTSKNQHRSKVYVTKRIKLYMAAYCDPALAFLSVASLWEHFVLAQQGKATLSKKAPLKRIFIDEAQQALIPLLDMLGLGVLQAEVEEQVMQWGHHQKDYQYLLKRLAQAEDTRSQAFKVVQKQLQPAVPQARLGYKLQTPVQIYNPQFPEKAHPETFQKLTVDVLVDTEADCYTALRWIHRFWQPVEHSLIDHIGVSKLNGDRYLNTTVIIPLGNNHIRAHFSIRTHEMEQINQWGLIALQQPKFDHIEFSHVWWNQRDKGFSKICSAPLGALPETLYVFSPQGELFRFHRGCTVVDYAYQVHSELAHQCKRFKINGEVVGPATILHHLDLVELTRDPQFPGPNRAWLNAARTDRARGHLERFLKRRNRGQLYGRTVLNRQLQALSKHYRIDIPEHRLEQVLNQTAHRLNFERLENLLAEIAAGRVSTDPILHPLFSEEMVRQIELPTGLRLLPHQLSLAQCCKPRPGDDLAGRARYRDEQIVRLKIHRRNCQHINHLQDAIELKWRLQPKLNAVARLELTALSAQNLFSDALAVFQPNFPEVILHKMEAMTHNGIARLSFTVEAKDQRLIDKIAKTLENLSEYQINNVQQMQLLFSEREALVKPVNPAGFNPYRRQPVQDRDMLFGRSEELAHIYDILDAGVGIIFMQGQKRVGKTSLLLHLKRYYLNRRSVLPVFVDFQILGNLTGSAFYYEIANTVYNDLQIDHRAGNIEPPLQELFEMAPTVQLAGYLKSIQSHFGFNKLVLLIDEFSRTIDAYQQGILDNTFFDRWRGVIQATGPEINYVMVVQQQTYKHLRQQQPQAANAPIWRLLELGETALIEPLREKDARHLIERPTYNHLEYSPEAIRYVWRLTGGSPFLIQAFCFNLVRHMVSNNRRQVKWTDVNIAQIEFMHPNESLFAHLLDVIHDIPHATIICRQFAKMLDAADQPVLLTRLQTALPHISDEHLRNGLRILTNQHILVEAEPEMWQFASLLFGRWLAANTILEHQGVN